VTAIKLRKSFRHRRPNPSCSLLGCWVPTWKLSAPYRSSWRGRLDDQEVDQIACALVDWAPERMVWGSNWSHVEVDNGQSEDGALLDLLAQWVPEESRRARILTANPSDLYGFTDV
jgi:2-pyrone-4,6-dicarboxylate lactonase